MVWFSFTVDFISIIQLKPKQREIDFHLSEAATEGKAKIMIFLASIYVFIYFV